MNKVLNGAAFCLAVTLLSGCANHNKEVTTLPQQTANSSACLAEFTSLGQLDRQAFDIYRQQFDKLNESYAIYKKNSGMMGHDADEMMAMELSIKQRVICARVKNAVFLNVESRAQEINRL